MINDNSVVDLTKGVMMKQFTLAEKKAYAENKNVEAKKLENTLSSFLTNAMETKSGFEKLSMHYRISGIYAYSFHNNLLLMSQGATICNSFQNWLKVDRCVIKEQKAKYYVFAPMVAKVKDKDTDETKTFCKGFKLVPTFDISQTTGKELEYDHNSTNCNIADYQKIVNVVQKLSGVNVVEEYTGQARGYSDGQKMAVSTMSNNTDKAKTALHEFAHHLLHTGAKADKANLDKDTKEVEAESVAYLVMSYIGIDFELSAEYVATYKNGIQHARLDKVVKLADTVIKEYMKD